MPTTPSLLAVLAAVAAAAVVVPLTAAQAGAATGPYKNLPNGTRQAKTLVVGVDGTRYDKLLTADAPNLKALMAGGLTAPGSLYADPMAPTLSGPGWSTIATGVWPDKHLVKDNAFTGARFDLYPDMATRLETAAPAASTLVVGSWNPIADTVFNGRADLRIAESESDDKAAADAADYLANGNPDTTFVHFDQVDAAGHSYGGAGTQYAAAIHGVDALVGKLVGAVRSRPTYGSEDWLIVVTTDHGHTDAGGHGGNSAYERQTFVIADGAGYAPGSVRQDVRLVDVAPTVLKHEGVTADPAWKLDGRPVDEIVPDAFDALRPSLQTRVDETGIPATTTGWTHTAPSGWSVDNSALPSGGVTEWRGWAFATDEFWTSSGRGEGPRTRPGLGRTRAPRTPRSVPREARPATGETARRIQAIPSRWDDRRSNRRRCRRRRARPAHDRQGPSRERCSRRGSSGTRPTCRGRRR